MAGGTFSCGYTVGGVKFNYGALAVQDSSINFNYDIPEDENYDYSQEANKSDSSESPSFVYDFLKERGFNDEAIDLTVNSFSWVVFKTIISDGTKNVLKLLIKNSSNNFYVDLGRTVLTFAIYSILNGGLKTGLKELTTLDNKSGETALKGFVKDFSKGVVGLSDKYVINKAMIKTFEAAKVPDAKKFLELFKKHGVDFVPVEMASEYFKLGLSHLGTAIGFDFIASLVVDFLIEGKDGIKFGSSALKSTIKGIFTVAGTFAGCRTLGTAFGAVVAELAVDHVFLDENGNVDEAACGIATGTAIAGAVGGLAFATFVLTNPAGLVVGLCIAGGAAITFGLYAIGYNIDKISAWIDDLSLKSLSFEKFFNNFTNSMDIGSGGNYSTAWCM